MHADESASIGGDKSAIRRNSMGEGFWGGTPQCERQRRVLQQYHNQALESAPDSVMAPGFIGLPFRVVKTAVNALASLGRPASRIQACALRAAMQWGKRRY